MGRQVAGSLNWALLTEGRKTFTLAEDSGYVIYVTFVIIMLDREKQEDSPVFGGKFGEHSEFPAILNYWMS